MVRTECPSAVPEDPRDLKCWSAVPEDPREVLHERFERIHERGSRRDPRGGSPPEGLMVAARRRDRSAGALATAIARRGRIEAIIPQ
jgi:hypothetical protein